MPPKMLTRMPFTCGSRATNVRALRITSAFAPPPMSRKLAGLPPTRATISSVVITRPAPFPTIPTSPSSLTYVRPSFFASNSSGFDSSVSAHAAYSCWRNRPLSSMRIFASAACTCPSAVSASGNVARLEGSQPPVHIDGLLDDLLGCRGRHLFDIYASCRRDHHDGGLRFAVEDDAEVVFFFDIQLGD